MCSCTHATAQVITMLYTHARQVLKWNNHVSDSMTMSLVCCSVESGVRSSFVCTLCGRGGPRQLARMLHVRRTHQRSSRTSPQPNDSRALQPMGSARAQGAPLGALSYIRPPPRPRVPREARAERLHAGAASPPYAPSRSSMRGKGREVTRGGRFSALRPLTLEYPLDSLLDPVDHDSRTVGFVTLLVDTRAHEDAIPRGTRVAMEDVATPGALDV